MHFLLENALFFISIALLLFLPGYAIMRWCFSRIFSSLETFILAVPLSIVALNFLIILIGKTHTAITKTSILFSLSLALLALFIATRKTSSINSNATPNDKKTSFAPLRFTKRQGGLIVLILALTIFIKSVYLSAVILPTSTDLGHHMYWSKVISSTGKLPVYVERNIIEADDTHETMHLGDPVAIDDFIIGEHLIFAAFNLLSGQDYISSFPILVLLLINVFTVLACALVASAGSSLLFNTTESTASKKRRASALIFILTLFLLGPIYSLSSPQTKFVSGGVVGNMLGNLLIPCAVYLYSRALTEKRSSLLALAFFMTFGLVYIHHLSTLVFLFVFLTTLLCITLLSYKTLGKQLHEWSDMIFSPAPLTVALLAILFFFAILAPSYADHKALDTAIGSPTKATRTGLTFMQYTFATGEGRLGLGLFGLSVLAFSYLFTQKKLSSCYASWFVFSWGGIVTVMSLRPQWLFLDIPSNRISSYAVFPFAILSVFALYKVFQSQSATRYSIARLSGVVVITLLVSGGMYDNAQSLLAKTKAQEAVQTYAVATYLASHTSEETLILKDHNYIVADSWMKLAFLRGYTYPLSRGYFKRYEDETKPREMCTLWMIAVPNSDKGKKCFNETGVRYVVINPHFDAQQFRTSPDFTSVYQSNDVAVYRRK